MPNIPAFFLFFILTYAFAEAKNPLISAYQNEQIESASRTTKISLINMVDKIYVAIVSLLMGWVATYSIAAAWTVIAVLIIVATPFVRVHRISVHLATNA